VARRRKRSPSTRSSLYWLARLLGDIGAVRKGPRRTAKRFANKLIGRYVVSRMWLR